MNVGENIKRLRVERNMTQAELAIKAQVHQTQVARWEASANLPNLESVYKLSQALRMSFAQFLKEATK